MNLITWIVIFLPALVIEVFCYITNPIACILTRREERTDRVKRIDNGQHTLMRDYPIKFFTLWNTHDNAIDEYWYGLFDEETKKTQADYDSSWWFRYYNRVAWLYRNNAYGWLYTKFFSRPVEPLLKQYQDGVEDVDRFWYNLELYKSSFMLEAHVPFLYAFGVILWVYSLTLWAFDMSAWYVLAVPPMVYWSTLNNRYFTVKMGWKSHKGFPRKMYANRVPPFGIREYEND